MRDNIIRNVAQVSHSSAVASQSANWLDYSQLLSQRPIGVKFVCFLQEKLFSKVGSYCIFEMITNFIDRTMQKLQNIAQ